MSTCAVQRVYHGVQPKMFMYMEETTVIFEGKPNSTVPHAAEKSM